MCTLLTRQAHHGAGQLSHEPYQQLSADKMSSTNGIFLRLDLHLPIREYLHYVQNQVIGEAKESHGRAPRDLKPPVDIELGLRALTRRLVLVITFLFWQLCYCTAHRWLCVCICCFPTRVFNVNLLSLHNSACLNAMSTSLARLIDCLSRFPPHCKPSHRLS